MVTRGSWTRRSFLHAAVGTVALGTKGLSGAVAAPYVLQKGSKVTFWGGLIFSDKANKLLQEAVKTWGDQNGITTEVVMINQNETVQKVSAAIASNTMPDALDMSLDLLMVLSKQGVFLPLDDVYDSIGKAHGGWFAPVASATDTSKVVGGRTGIPFGVSGNLLLRRTDLLKTAGFEKPPATWQELVQQAAVVTKPPVFGLGLAFSNVGDGNVQISALQSFGGRIADDTGHQSGDQVERDPRIPALGQGCLGQESLPARQYNLGRRRGQPGLSRGTGSLHRQYGLSRYRGQDPGP